MKAHGSLLLSLLCPALVMLRRDAVAQQAADRYGDLTDDQTRMEDLAHYFTNVEDALFRRDPIQQVPADAP